MTSPLPEDKQEYTSCWGMPEKSEARAQRHLGLGPEICWYPGAPHILPYPLLHLSLSQLPRQPIQGGNLPYDIPTLTPSITEEFLLHRRMEKGKLGHPSQNILCSQITDFSSPQVKRILSVSFSQRQ